MILNINNYCSVCVCLVAPAVAVVAAAAVSVGVHSLSGHIIVFLLLYYFIP